MSNSQPDWSRLQGAYRSPYDPRPAITGLEADPLDPAAWLELSENLHHQGDVGKASYAALPLIVQACSKGPRDWHFHGLVSTIELERHRKSNPPLPAWLREDYNAALEEAAKLAHRDLRESRDPLTSRTALAVIALTTGNLEIGAVLVQLEESELREYLDEHLSWSELYGDADSRAPDEPSNRP